jgi:hypothetical protein
VADTADLGDSFPDLVVGYRGRDYLVEAKSRKGKLSDGQSAFASVWMGAPVVILKSAEQAEAWIKSLPA